MRLIQALAGWNLARGLRSAADPAVIIPVGSSSIGAFAAASEKRHKDPQSEVGALLARGVASSLATGSESNQDARALSAHSMRTGELRAESLVTQGAAQGALVAELDEAKAEHKRKMEKLHNDHELEESKLKLRNEEEEHARELAEMSDQAAHLAVAGTDLNGGIESEEQALLDLKREGAQQLAQQTTFNEIALRNAVAHAKEVEADAAAKHLPSSPEHILHQVQDCEVGVIGEPEDFEEESEQEQHAEHDPENLVELEDALEDRAAVAEVELAHPDCIPAVDADSLRGLLSEGDEGRPLS